MPAEIDRELAVAVVRSDFGNVVAQVYDSIIKLPGVFKAIVRRCQPLSSKDIRKCMIVLLQHHLIRADENTYIADIQAARLRIRVPAMLNHVGKLIGSLAERMLEQIFLHGRIRLSRILTNMESVDPSSDRVAMVRDFQKLAQERFIERVGVEDSQRFFVPKELHALGTMMAGDGAAQDNASTNIDAHVYWRMAYPAFHRDFKRHWVVKHFKDKFGGQVADVANVLVGQIQFSDVAPSGAHSARVMSLDEIQQAVRQNPTTTSEVLSMLCEESEGVFQSVGAASFQYQPQQATILAQRAAITKTIEERFDSKCLRLFNVLFAHNILDEDQLCGLAVVASFKATRLLLHKLWDSKLIFYEEVPRSLDRVTSHCCYFWRTDIAMSKASLAAECEHTLLNLLLRIAHEKEKNEHVLSQPWLLEEPEPNSDEALDEDEKVKSDRALLKKTLASLKHLQTALIQMDKFYMQLCDFDELRFYDEHLSNE